MTINNNPSPRSWRNRIQRAPRRNWVIFLILVLAFFACAIITSSCLGRVVQAETVEAQNSASWWQRLWNSGDSATQTETAGANAATVDIDFTPSQDVLTQLNKLGYESIEEFATAWGLKIGSDMANGETDPREITVCPFETQGCVRILREKNEDAVIEWAFYAENPDNCWHDGYRRLAGEVRPGGYQIPERTGVPPQFKGLLEGITIRKCQEAGTSGTLPGSADPTRTPTETGSAPRPTSAPQGTGGGTSSTAWSEAAARSEFKLASEVKLSVVDVICFAAKADDGSFSIYNPRSEWINGWRIEPGTLRPGATEQPGQSGIPPKETVEAEGATLCPQ
jgi:hypothetical protein